MDIKATATLTDADVDKIATAVVSKLQASATVTKTEKAPATGKGTADKPKAETKKEEPAKDAPGLPEVLAALQKHAAEHNKDSALEILKRFGPKAAEVPEDKRAELIEALKEAPTADETPAVEDEF